MDTFSDSAPVHETCAALALRFPEWDISYSPWRAIYVAEKRWATGLRLLGSASPSDLAVRIETAEQAEAAGSRCQS